MYILVAVLHLAFVNEDGSLHYLDMDLCIPTFKAANGANFDGNSVEYDKYLTRERPVGWREEQKKLDYTIQNTYLKDDKGLDTFIKIKMVNRDTMIPSQVTSLNHDFVLIQYCEQFSEPFLRYRHYFERDKAGSICSD